MNKDTDTRAHIHLNAWPSRLSHRDTVDFNISPCTLAFTRQLNVSGTHPTNTPLNARLKFVGWHLL